MYTKKDKEYSMKIKNGEKARYYLSMANDSFDVMLYNLFL